MFLNAAQRFPCVRNDAIRSSVYIFDAPQPMHPAVTVIYVNYNSSELLIRSAESVMRRCTSVDFEIIVVDNQSAPAEKQILFGWCNNQQAGLITYIENKANLGFASANNLGAEQAKGKYLFFLNPDTEVINDVIFTFHQFMETSADNVAACGGNLLHPDGSPAHSYGNFPGTLLELCNIGLGLRLLFNAYFTRHVAIGSVVYTDHIMRVPYVVGAAMFISSHWFNKIRGFDETYFLYYEETDLFRNLHNRGLKSFILPEARLIHHEGGAIESYARGHFNYFKFEHLLKSKRYYYRKWHGSLYAHSLEPLFFLQIVVQYFKGKMGNSFHKLFTIFFNRGQSG